MQAKDEATIVEIEGPETARLAGFGLYPGVSVTIRQTFPSFVIKTEETELALESGVAEKIQVDPASGPTRQRRRLRGRPDAAATVRGSDPPVGSTKASKASNGSAASGGRSPDPPPPASSPARFPRKTFLVGVIVVCSALTISALHTFFTLRTLRTEYLENRGHDIAALVDSQLRGPGRRFDSAVRQRALESTLEAYAESVTFLALLDRSGQVTAQAGEAGPSGGVYLFRVPLGGPRGPRWGSASPGSGGSETLQIGLRADQADFISNQAYIHLGVSLATVLLLAALAIYFLRTLDQFLALQAREASERQLAQLGRLSATLAHEIRNPLGAMKGLTQLVQEELPRDHRTHELMATVVSEAERLEQLVTDLLAFARPRALSVRSVPIAELTGNVAAFLRPEASERGITIRLEPAADELRVRADPDGLRQVLLNVLGNALDATTGPGSVDLEIAERGSLVEIRVLDRGSGLGSGKPEDLFQPFRTTKTHGSGLGLSVSRQIVERLGGDIALENRPGGGALCRIRLPKGE